MEAQVPSGLRVGYVLTHYPRLAQTFIASEIDGVERAGVYTRVFAMNAPGSAELTHPGAADRSTTAVYLKPNFQGGLGAFLKLMGRHPIRVSKVLGVALASAGGSPMRMVRRTAHLLQAALVAETARRENLQYFHAQFGLAPATIAWFASLLTGTSGVRIPFGFTIHGFHDFVDRAESRLDLKARDAVQVLCVSDFTRSQLCLFTHPELWHRFAVARCGIDLNTFRYADPTSRQDNFTIMALGRLSPEKGFNVMLEALTALKAQGQRHKLLIVGDGPLRPQLEDAARVLGISDLVKFTGELPPDQVRRHLRTADVFCVPSFNEGLPISIMEAMAMGVPVVATWIAGIPELASNEVTALTVPPARADAIASAIRRLVNEPGLGVHLARNARRRVEEQHDMWRCATDIADRFKAVAVP